MMPILPRNQLAYPSGVPAGINPNHIAFTHGSACRFSGIARNGNFIDLTRGAAGSIVGSPTRALDGNLGDSVVCSTSSAHTFSGRPTSDPRMTFAAIVRWSNLSAGSFSFIFANSTNTGSYNAFFAGNDGSIELRYGTFNYTSGSSFLVNNVPYFVAGSVDQSSVINFVVRRLDTGAVRSAIGGPTGAYADTPNGTYSVNNWGANSLGSVGRIAAVAYLNSYLTIPQLRRWAEAPWDFWYPPTLNTLIFATTAAVTASSTARQNAVTVNTG